VDYQVGYSDESDEAFCERGVRFLKKPQDTLWGGRVALLTDEDGHILRPVQIDCPEWAAVANHV
jgi:hypothetical protein